MWKKYVFVVTSFFFLTLPGSIEDLLSLQDRLQGDGENSLMAYFLDIYGVLFPVIAIGILIFGIWWVRDEAGEGIRTVSDQERQDRFSTAVSMFYVVLFVLAVLLAGAMFTVSDIWGPK